MVLQLGVAVCGEGTLTMVTMVQESMVLQLRAAVCGEGTLTMVQ